MIVLTMQLEVTGTDERSMEVLMAALAELACTSQACKVTMISSHDGTEEKTNGN